MNAACADTTHSVEDGPGRARSSRPRSARAALAVALATLSGVATLTLAVVGMGAASAATLNGVATTALPSNDSYLASGGSNTEFTVTLPSGAACTGDTAHDGYHVWSYLVERSATISSTTFSNATGPSQGFGLYESDLNYYGPVNTAQTTGQIIGIPNDFQWGAGVSGGSFTAAQLLYTGGSSGIWEAGLACANSSGVLTDNWNTQITFTKSTSDPNGFTWSAVPGPSGSTAAAITSGNNTTFTEGAAGSFTPTATGTPTPTITETGPLPAGVSFTDGALTGTPTVSGTFPVTLTATNGIGNPATQAFTLTVNPPPGFHISTTSLPDAVVGTAYSVQMQTTGANGGTVVWKKTASLPKGLALSSTGLLSGTPTTKAAGSFSVGVSARLNKETPVTATFPLTVEEAPVFNPKAPLATSFDEGVSSTFTVTATGNPTPIISEVGALPTGVTFSDGVLSGTPQVTTNTTTYTLTITASNGVTPNASESFVLTDIAPLVITTTSIPNGSPGASYGPVALGVTGGEGAYTWKKGGTLPKGLALSSTGQLSGTLSSKLVAGQSYPVPVEVGVKEGKTKVVTTATLTLNVVAAS